MSKKPHPKKRPSVVATPKVLVKLTEPQRVSLVGLRSQISQMEQRHSQMMCGVIGLASQIAAAKNKLSEMGLGMLEAHGIDSSKVSVRINEQTGEVEEEPVLAAVPS